MCGAPQVYNELVQRTCNMSPAELLIETAVALGSGDDQTALVVDLNRYRAATTSAQIMAGLCVCNGVCTSAMLRTLF